VAIRPGEIARLNSGRPVVVGVSNHGDLLDMAAVYVDRSNPYFFLWQRFMQQVDPEAANICESGVEDRSEDASTSKSRCFSPVHCARTKVL
jgi:hypothetical protein